jgi:hypothetical protein
MRSLVILVLLAAALHPADVGSAMWFSERPDADYARRAVLVARSQIAICRIADERAPAGELRDLAQRIAPYALRTVQRLESIAARQGFHLPLELDAEHRLVVDALGRGPAAGFTRRCATALAATVQEGLQLALDEVEQGRDAGFRASARLDGEVWKECSGFPALAIASE